MNQSTQARSLVVSTDSNPGKAFANGIRLSIFCIVMGIIAIWAGQKLIDSLTYFSRDYEKIMAEAVYVLGYIMIMLAVIYPFCMKYIAKKNTMYVYTDCIEGVCFRIVASTQTLVNFQETYNNISSVSTVKNKIMVNLKDGCTLRCNANNAENVAAAIRERIV